MPKHTTAVRLDPDIEEYLSSLTGRARAEAIREALRDWVARDPDRSTERVIALHAEADKLEAQARQLRADADHLSLTSAEERKRRDERREKAKAAILAALSRINPPYWGDLPTMDIGKAILEEHRIDRAFMQSVIKEAQGQ